MVMTSIQIQLHRLMCGGFIDFNGNGKFDEGEQSDVVQVNGNNQIVELTFKNTQVIDTSKDVVNFRVRIAKDEAQVERPNGIAYSGEVEDNQIQVAHPHVEIKKKLLVNKVKLNQLVSSLEHVHQVMMHLT